MMRKFAGVTIGVNALVGNTSLYPELTFTEDVRSLADVVPELEGQKMTPEQIAKPNTEHAHQCAYFCWISQEGEKEFPGLEFAFAVPNGGQRNKVNASRLKAEGVRAGVPDVIVPISQWGPDGSILWRCGLYIEFKKPAHEKRMKGTVTDKDQIRYRDFLLSQNYSHFVAFSWLQARDETIRYLT